MHILSSFKGVEMYTLRIVLIIYVRIFRYLDGYTYKKHEKIPEVLLLCNISFKIIFQYLHNIIFITFQYLNNVFPIS